MMKKITLLAAFLAASFTFAFAQGNTKAEIDAAIKAGHKTLNTKIVELQKSLKDHNADATQTNYNEVLKLMRTGVSQTRQDAELLTGTERDVRYKHMLALENIVSTYLNLSKDVDANGDKVVATAKSFLAEYK